MRYITCALMLLLFFSPVLADIGPSPSFSFSISNISNFPDYDFYNAGNIWPERLDPVLQAEKISVYKLNTHLRIYAVPKNISPSLDFQSILSQSAISQQINLAAGHTEFEISSLDIATNSLVLITKSQEPDVPNSFNPLGLAAVAVVALAIIAFIVLKLRK